MITINLAAKPTSKIIGDGLSQLHPISSDPGATRIDQGDTYASVPADGERVAQVIEPKSVVRHRSLTARSNIGGTMRREKLFSAGGYYPFVVNSNSLMHHEAIKHGLEFTSAWIDSNPELRDRSVRILDLACGGMPIAVCKIMSQLGDITFDYTGVDINPDQVEQAKEFSGFEENTSNITVIEGNAWDLEFLLKDQRKFDIVFSGMNFHHGNPIELYYLANQLNLLLDEGGIIFSHDEYRPEDTVYIQRPDIDPFGNNSEYRLIGENTLSGTSLPDFGFPVVRYGDHDFDWREQFVADLSEYLRIEGGSREYVEQTAEHALTRDFPLSASEAALIFESLGFKVTINRGTDDGHMLGRYFSFLNIRKPKDI